MTKPAITNGQMPLTISPNLWVEKMGKAEALWQAKCTLREEGHPVRDWAGWVLTGDPD